MIDRAPKRGIVLFPEIDRKQRARTHRKAEEDGREKRHERIRRAYRRQRVFAQRLPDDERIRDVIKLLE